MNLYNDCEPFAAEWLKSLVKRGCIPEGVVDGREFEQIDVSELVRYRQCHFFCGIGGWPEALRLAGLQHLHGIWTQSLPCQPLSSAGRQQGEKDERHLWPEFYPLISECRPAILFGEQSGSKHGREWLDGVSLDLEELGYVVGSSDLCAAGIGGPHIRQRIYWGAVRVADSGCSECDWWNQPEWKHWRTFYLADSGKPGRLADSKYDAGCPKHVDEQGGRSPSEADTAECSGISRMADAEDSNGRRGISKQEAGTGPDGERRLGPASSGTACRLGYTVCSGLEGYSRDVNDRDESGRHNQGTAGPIAASGPWDDWYTVFCRDGKTRRIGTGVQPLAHGVPRGLGSVESELQRLGVDAKRSKAMRKWSGSRLAKAGRNRVGRLRGYGNAIVPPLAALFIVQFIQSVLQFHIAKEV